MKKSLLTVFFAGILLALLHPSAFAQKTWARTYGGASFDRASSIQQTTDGGFVVAGYTDSFGAGQQDFWVLKLDASGDIDWQKTYGGVDDDRAYSIRQTTDGGYVVAGYTYSFGAGNDDLWVLKLDASGNVTWQKTFGGTDWDEAQSIQQTSDGGYVVAGQTYSFGAGFNDVWVLKLDASGNVLWQKTYGGASADKANSIQQTTDGGFVVAGYTDVGAGSGDFWVLKLDASGNVAWQKTYGGAGADLDIAYPIQQTTDGGFVVTGRTDSFGAGSTDFWVLKLDASGNVTWQKTYGGGSWDRPWSAQQTTDGGFVVAGETYSFGAGFYDFWVLKLDASGNVQWQKTYGGANGDYVYSIQQTTDGGFVAAGLTDSFGAGSLDFWVLKLGANGDIDASCTFIADTAVTGADSTATPTDTAVAGADSPAVPADTAVTGADSTATVNEQCYGCTADSFEPDGNCYVTKSVILGGEVQSHNFCDNTEDWISFNACTERSYTIDAVPIGLLADVALELYDNDCASLLDSNYGGAPGAPASIMWTAPADGTYHIKVLQFDATTGKDRGYDITLTGDTSPCATWARTYDGISDDVATSIQQTTDGGFVVAGLNSFGTGVEDLWILKLDASGTTIEWQKTYGGASLDWAWSIQQTSDGGYVVAGRTESFGAGTRDFWVLKLDASGNVTWQKTYGGATTDYAYSIQQTADGGYVVAGSTSSFGSGFQDFWVLKLDASGNASWQKTYGGASDDWADSIQQTADGGYAVAGVTDSFGAGSSDFWVLKLDASGNVTWQKTYGGAGDDGGGWDSDVSIQQTTDGGYVVAGQTQSFGAGGWDSWVLKLDASGNVSWQKTYGGALCGDVASSIQQTTDGGFVVAGQTCAFGAGSDDFWVLKLDASGNVTWQKTYGGASTDLALHIQQTTDGGFVMTGFTASFGAGGWDFWVLKMDANGDIDASCTFIADTAVTGVNSTASVLNTSISGVSSTASITDTAVTGADSTAAVDEQCASGGGCAALSCDSIAIDADPVCDGTAQTFTANYSGGVAPFTVEWDLDNDTFYDDFTGNPTPATVLPVGANTIGVRVTDSCGAGAQVCTTSTTATVNANPAPTITGPTEICTGGSVTLDAGAGYASYLWSTGAKTQAIMVSPAVTTTYDVTVADANGCQGADSHTVAVGCPTWARAYGGGLGEGAYSIQPTSDGGYVMAGYTRSFGAGNIDLWVLKLDALGIVSWQKTYGGASSDYAYSIQQTTDGGFVVAGYTQSFGAGLQDIWVLKLDASGNVTWQKTYGGASNDGATYIQQTSDGGYVVAGYTASFGAGGADFWVLKLDASGNVSWQKTYGGVSSDYVRSIQQTTDGGFVVAGVTNSFGAGLQDIWVLKLDASGNVTWQKTYGGVSGDYVRSIQQTSDGGYVVAGYTASFGAGGYDFWVLKLDASGNAVWQKSYGGASSDYAYSIQQTTDGGFVVAGFTSSFGTGSWDFWVLKLDALGIVTWQKTYGGASSDYAYSIQQTTDGGFVVAGETDSFDAGSSDFWVLKLGANGDIDASCTFIADTAVTGAISLATPADTAVAGADSPAVPADSAATVADSTATPDEQCTSAPNEPSDETSPTPLEIADATATEILVEEIPTAAEYVVYGNPLGSFEQPLADDKYDDGAQASGCYAPWAVTGPGEVTLTYAVPNGWWVVVSAWSTGGESSTGRDSAGTERTTVGNWTNTALPCP